MVKKILIALAAVVVVSIVVIATRPGTYHVQRTTEIAAPREAVFAIVGDFREFSKWSPWQRRDPALHATISTPSTGVDASYAWEGDKNVGKGRMTFTEHLPPVRVVERLEFFEPFPSVATTGLTLVPVGHTATTITWWMEGHNGFMAKAFSLVMDFDKMIGKDFDEGLANLKRVAESAAARPAR